jgi:hypothetical protein
MGTRSTIALEFADGTVEQVYCHWDGYLENNGVILSQHYMNPFKVKELVGLGGFSSLRPTIDETAESAYTQRGEDISVEKFKNFADYVANHQYEEYEYILRQVDGKAVWFVADHSERYIPLTVALESVKETV